MKKHTMKMKLVLTFAIIIVVTVCIQGLVSFIGLNRAHNLAISTVQSEFDSVIKTSVDNLIGVLNANYMRYQNGEITKEEAYNQAVWIMKIQDTIMATDIFGPTLKMERALYI